jgi:hypothetical protein
MNDFSVREFIVKDEEIKNEAFSVFFEIVRKGRIAVSHTNIDSLIKISRDLKNDQLELLFKALSLSKSILSEKTVDIDCGRGLDMSIERVASHFWSYSTETLGRLGCDFLNEILSNEYLCLSSEDALFRMIVSLGDDYRSLLKHIRVDFLSSSSLHDFFGIISIEDVCESQWFTIVSRLEGHRDDLIEQRRFRPLLKSKIISEFGTIPWIFEDFKHNTFELLYRGSRDSFKISEFHRRCDGHHRTLVVIETKKGHIFGGYTPLAWDSTTKNYKTDESMQTFLFTLKNPHNRDAIRFGLKPGGQNAIYCNPDRLVFGNHAICIWDNCDTNTSCYTNVTQGFENPTGIESRVLFDGAYNFTVSEIEVLSVIG